MKLIQFNMVRPSLPLICILKPDTLITISLDKWCVQTWQEASSPWCTPKTWLAVWISDWNGKVHGSWKRSGNTLREARGSTRCSLRTITAERYALSGQFSKHQRLGLKNKNSWKIKWESHHVCSTALYSSWKNSAVIKCLASQQIWLID